MKPTTLKILILAPFAPDLQGVHGGSRATAAIIEMLSKRHEVHVLYLTSATDPEPRQLPSGCAAIEAVCREDSPPGKRRFGARTLRSFGRLFWKDPQWVEHARSAAFTERAANLTRRIQPDVIHYEFHVMAQYLPLLRSVCASARHVVTEHEPGITAGDRTNPAASLRNKVYAFARSLAWRRFEKRVLAAADAIIAFTQSDASELSELLDTPKPPIFVIPFRLPLPERRVPSADPSTRSDFLFIGNFRHPPNVDAALRLAGGIYPKIASRLPEAQLTIVGSDPPNELASFRSERISITGWVDDPSVYLAAAAVVVVPLRQGGGLRVKMVEACAAGKAIIASPLAVEGLGLIDGTDVLLADTDDEFASEAVALLSDETKRAALEQASRQWAEREQSEEKWAAEYDALYSSLFTRAAKDFRAD